MIHFKGTGPLALRSESLPVRARVGLMLVGAQLALNQLRLSKNLPIAQAAFALARRWHDGERFDPRLIEDALAHEYNKGVLDCEIEAKSAIEKSAWFILEDALLYTAFHATRELGTTPSSVICEVDENLFDQFEDHLRALLPTAVDVLFRAADLLSRRPDTSFAQFKSAISPPDHAAQ